MAEKEYQGLYAHGVLEGVDFVTAGNGFDDSKSPISWGSSIKLNFSTLEKITKDVNGIKVSTQAKRPFLIALSCESEEINALVQKWNAEIGKTLHLKLQPSKNSTFKLSE